MKKVNAIKNDSLRIAGIFLTLGISTLIAAVLYNSTIFSFIGLGLVLWGAIFFAAKPGKFVENSLLESTINPTYATLERIINDLNYNKRSYYLPAYSQNGFLPEYFKNLKDSVVFVSGDDFVGLPSVEEMVGGKFLSQKDHGMFVVSPGSGILNQIERKVNIDFTTVPVSELCSILPRCMTEFFNLAKEMELQVVNDSLVRLSVEGLLYESLYIPENPLRSVGLLGCPTVSAVACALAKSSRKAVIIKEQRFFANGRVEVEFAYVTG